MVRTCLRELDNVYSLNSTGGLIVAAFAPETAMLDTVCLLFLSCTQLSYSMLLKVQSLIMAGLYVFCM